MKHLFSVSIMKSVCDFVKVKAYYHIKDAFPIVEIILHLWDSPATKLTDGILLHFKAKQDMMQLIAQII